MPSAVPEEYVTAGEAARMLGVDVQTIYTYVRRKGLRSVDVPGERRRMYWRPDVERLMQQAGGGQPGAAAGLGSDTAVTLITSSGPFYRGQSAANLSAWASLEHVAGVLWDAPAAFDAGPPPVPDGYGLLRQATRHLPTCEQAIPALALLAAATAGANDLDKPSFVRASAGIARLLAALVSGRDWPDGEPIHAVVAHGLGAVAPFDDLIRRALVLGASHEFDPSSYAVRSAANTGVSPYHAAIVGLATYRGRRLAINRWAAVTSFIQEVLAAPSPADVTRRRLRSDPVVPGFDPGVYKAGDPRADALLGAMADAIGGDPGFAALREAIDAAREIAGLRPSFILANAFLNLRLGRNPREVTFTVCARVVGWLALAMEQVASSDLVRLRANYVGPLPRGG